MKLTFNQKMSRERRTINGLFYFINPYFTEVEFRPK
jgi:hypothetical protein